MVDTIRMKKIKKILVFIGAFLALILLFLAAGRLYLGSDHAHHLIQARINEAIPGAVSWEAARLSFFDGRVELRNILIKGPEEDKLIALDRVFLEFSWLALLKRELRVNTAILEKPRVHLAMDREGVLNLTRAFSAGEPEEEKPVDSASKTGAPFNVRVGEFTLVDGFFQFKTEGGPKGEGAGRVELHHIELAALDGDLSARSLEVDLKIDRTELDMAGVNTRLDRFRLEGALAGGRLDSLALDLKAHDSSMALSGDASDVFTTPGADLELTLDVALSDVREIFRIEPGLSGRATIRLGVKGALNDPEASLVLDFSGGDIAGHRVNRLQLACALKERVLTIDDLSLDAPPGKLALSGQVDLSKAFVDGFITSPADPGAISYTLNLDQKETRLETLPMMEAGIRGGVNSTLSLQGRGVSPETLSARADLALSLKGLALDGALSPVDVEASVRAGLEKGRVEVERLDARTGDARVRVSGTYEIASRAMAGEVKLAIPNLAGELAPVGVTDARGGLAVNARVSGSVDKPEANVQIRGDGLAFREITVGSVLLNARLARDGMATLSEFTLENQGSEIRGSGAVQVFGPGLTVNPDPTAEISLAFRDAEATDFLDAAPVRGSAHGSLELSGSLVAPRASLTLRGDNLMVEEIRVGDLDALLTFAEGVVALDRLNLRNGDSALDLTGVIQVTEKKSLTPLDDPVVDVTLDNGVVVLEDFVDSFKGTARLSARVRGSVMAPRVNLTLRGENLIFDETRVGDLEAVAGFAGGAVSLDRLHLRNGGSALDLTGVVQVMEKESLTPLDDPLVELTLDNGVIVLGDFVDSLEGTARLSARVRGSLGDPEAEASIQGSDLSAENHRLGDLEAHVRFSRGRLSLDPVLVRNGDSRVDLSGEVDLLDMETLRPLEDPGLNLELAAAPLFLEDFIHGMKGKITLKGSATGSAADPAGSLELHGEAIDLGVQKIAGVQLRSGIVGGRIDIDALRVTMAPKEEILARGWISLDKDYDLHLESGGVSLEHIDALEGREFGDAKIVLDLAGTGNLENPAIQGKVGVNDLRFNDKKIEDVQLLVSLEDHVARISGKRNISLDARLDLKTRDAFASVGFDRTDLGPYFKLAGQEDLTGVITGKITAEGNVEAPEKLRAEVDISDLGLFIKEAMLVQTREIKASLENGVLLVPDVHVELPEEGRLDIRGEGRLDGAVNFSAEGHVPARTARLFTDELPDIAGRVTFSAGVTGAMPRPDVTADISLEKIEMTVPTLYQKLHDLDAHIQITPDAVVLEYARGMLDKGRFELSGKVDLEQMRPSKILVEVNARALPMTVPDAMEVIVDADLTIAGGPEESVIRGGTTLIEGRYYKDVNLKLLKTIRKRTRQEAAPSSETDLPFLKNMAMDVTVNHKDPFIVDNNIALLSLKPDLRIHGTVAQPRVSGRAEVDSGTITYQKKVFEIKKGVFDFINPYKIEPTIDVMGEVKIREWTIYLTVSGVPDNLEFKLTSSPSETQEDIASLIIFGKTNQERAESSGSLSPTQMIADVVADGLAGNIKEAMGLDILEVEYNEAEEKEDLDEIKVTVGEELSRRVTLKYGMDAKKGQVVQRVTAEYKLLENLLFRIHEDTSDNFGGEIQYRLEFR